MCIVWFLAVPGRRLMEGGRDIVSELLFSKCNWNNVPESHVYAMLYPWILSGVYVYRAAYWELLVGCLHTGQRQIFARYCICQADLIHLYIRHVCMMTSAPHCDFSHLFYWIFGIRLGTLNKTKRYTYLTMNDEYLLVFIFLSY